MDFHRYVREHLASLHTGREPEIVDELAQHLNDLYNEAVATGLDHEAALARAVAALPAQSSELANAIESASRTLPGLIADRWTRSLNDPVPVSRGRFAMVTDLQRDIRYAVRMLLRTPAFTLIVITTMALGIGANAVIFSAIDALLLRSAPVANPDRIVSVYSSHGDGRVLYSTSSFPDYLDLRDSGSFDGLAAFAGISLSFDAGGETLPLTGEIVTGNFFSVLGVHIATGRAFTDEEDRPGSQIRVAIVTHEFWTTFLGGDAAVVGRSISLNGNAYSIVGVTPRPFVSPVLGRAPQIYVPMALQPELRPPTAGVRRALGHGNLLAVRGLGWINMVGRLRSSDAVQDAATASAALAKRLAAEYPIRTARRAGSHAATSAAPASTADTPANVNGSVADTSKSSVPTSRESRNAPKSPIAVPMPQSAAASPRTSRRMSAAVVPSVTHTPISCVRMPTP